MRDRASACRCAVLAKRGISKRKIVTNATIHKKNGTKNQVSKAASTKPEVIKYTATYTNISAMVMTVSRTARAVCITFADTRPANSSW